MDIDPKDLGVTGLVKCVLHTGIALGGVGIALTWPQDFEGSKDFIALGVGVFLASATVEWVLRSWFTERVAEIAATEARIVAIQREIDKAQANQRAVKESDAFRLQIAAHGGKITLDSDGLPSVEW